MMMGGFPDTIDPSERAERAESTGAGAKEQAFSHHLIVY